MGRSKSGRIMWVPIELINEASNVKKDDNCHEWAEAFRHIAKSYSPAGRQLKKMRPIDFFMGKF